jgi:homoserine kinase type II
MMNVFLLWHVHDLGEEEDAKLLGVYSSEQKAEAARQRAVALPGFRECPEGFLVDRYELDQDYWTEGYVTMRYRP